VALANTVEIARRCNLTLVLGKPQLPDFPTPLVDGSACRWTTTSARPATKAWSCGLAALFPDPARRERERAAYVERLEFEIDTIVKMGFPGYFLIVSDFIVWAKANGCPVGPGAARAPARWWPTRCSSPTSTRCSTSCCSSAS
jgi:DNA polymerase III subunit alpha